MKVTVKASREACHEGVWKTEGQSFECADPSIHGDAVTVEAAVETPAPVAEPAPQTSNTETTE